MVKEIKTAGTNWQSATFLVRSLTFLKSLIESLLFKEKQLTKDTYDEKFIGKRQEDGKRYLVEGVEVSGMNYPENGGIRYDIFLISDVK